MFSFRVLVIPFFVYLCDVPHADGRSDVNFWSDGPLRVRSTGPKNPSLLVEVYSAGKVALTGELGYGLPRDFNSPTTNCDPGQADACYQYDDYARMYLTAANASNGYCNRIEWHSPYGRRLEDCFDLQTGVHWYGGGGPTYYDTWPIEHVSRREAPIIAGDSLGGYEYGGVTENYWLISSAVAIHVDEDVPLFFSVNSTRPNRACFVSQDKNPFKNRGETYLKYDLCLADIGENFKDVHQRAFPKYYARPTGTPDERMILQPFWSTWAEYKTEVNQSLVLELANKLIEEGFANSSHIEIDDNWEPCYGEAEFDSRKFPDPAGMTAALRNLGFRATLWTTPFINYGCPSFKTAFDRGYFVQDEKPKSTITGWWQGSNAGIIDFTNEEAVQWWSSRLELLRQQHGIDSFKFDAGEVSWLPPSHQLTGDVTNSPNIATTKYVQAVAKFGGLIEVRVGRQTQNEPVFVRMLDKDSRWGYDNGLKSLIPTLLDFGLKGYPFVLPDMIGGNAYGARPSKELFIRWMQANAFMPSVQFSLLPWDYDKETVSIVRQILGFRERYRDAILAAARQAVSDGAPMNRPMWWVDPEDENTQAIDDQYMLGDDILVAPVVSEGAISRDIYLPRGNWTIEVAGSAITYTGPLKLTNFSAPLNFLPFFVRQP